MEPHLFDVSVSQQHTAGVDNVSFIAPVDSNVFVPNGEVKNDGSFAFDSSVPIEFDNSVNLVYVNFPTPVTISKIYFQTASGKRYPRRVNLDFTSRALPGQPPNVQNLPQTIAEGVTILTLPAPFWSASRSPNNVETVRFELQNPTAEPSGANISLRVGFEVLQSCTCKLIANNSITRTFTQNTYRTVIPTWTPHLKLQLISSSMKNRTSTKVTVRKVA